MYPIKVEENGKKYVVFGDVKAELAPDDVVRKYVEDNKVELMSGTLSIDKTNVNVGEEITITAKVKFDQAGKYKIIVMPYDYQRSTFDARSALKTPDIVVSKSGEKKDKVKSDEIKKAFEKYFQGRTGSTAWLFADSNYYVADESKVKEVLKNTDIDKMRYTAEDFDCDDFAFALMGAYHMRYDTAKMAIFIIWTWWKEGSRTYGHALNAYYDGEQIRLIEPQNDVIFKVPSNWNLWVVIG